MQFNPIVVMPGGTNKFEGKWIQQFTFEVILAILKEHNQLSMVKMQV